MRLALLFATVLSVLAAGAPALASGGGHGEGGEGKKKAKGPQKERTYTSLKSWVMVDPFTISIIQDGRIRGKFTVSFGMDVPDDALREKAETIMPRLRDAWLSELNLYAATTLRPRRVADVAAVSGMIQQTADTVLGKPGAKVLMGQATVLMTP
jgi:flagellar basal body-associated protein FliL